ncbi:MAG: S8 family serine peptidase [Methanobacteriota archaeon]|nr:MAG: S8 family serine peptidase [Euryarchaeota archaeon]
MRRMIFAQAVFGLLVLSGMSMVIAQDNAEVQVLVGFDSHVNVELIESYGGRVEYVYDNLPIVLATIPENRIAALSHNHQIEYVEENGIGQITAQTLPWGVDKIDAELVWADPNKGTGIKIAILDSGMDYNHPDLNDNYVAGYDFYGSDDDDPMDENGHGTHVAGTVAAEDNDFGVVGVAPEADLYIGKVSDAIGHVPVADLVQGIDWAITNGADIISMSLGYQVHYQSLEDACDRAYIDNGIIVVAAAGNDGRGKLDTVDYPARYASVIAVSATDSRNKVPSWSSKGPSVELAAPGVSVYSTVPNNDYDYYSGTSMSTPHVSGTAALVMIEYPSMTASQVRQKLASSARDLGDAGRDSKYGYGLVDARKATQEPQGGTMHVNSIWFTEKNRGPSHRDLLVHVEIVDDNDNPVETARVYLELETPLHGTLVGDGTTEADGVVSFRYRDAESGHYIATVTDVTKADWIYDPTLNVETSDEYDLA